VEYLGDKDEEGDEDYGKDDGDEDDYSDEEPEEFLEVTQLTILILEIVSLYVEI
jgi:hypothetical protein